MFLINSDPDGNRFSTKYVMKCGSRNKCIIQLFNFSIFVSFILLFSKDFNPRINSTRTKLMKIQKKKIFIRFIGFIKIKIFISLNYFI